MDSADENADGAALIQYKLSGDATWSEYGTVSHPATTAIISGLTAVTLSGSRWETLSYTPENVKPWVSPGKAGGLPVFIRILYSGLVSKSLSNAESRHAILSK